MASNTYRRLLWSGAVPLLFPAIMAIAILFAVKMPRNTPEQPTTAVVHDTVIVEKTVEKIVTRIDTVRLPCRRQHVDTTAIKPNVDI